MSELSWKMQLKERFLTISVRSSGEEQPLQLPFLFTHWGDDCLNRSEQQGWLGCRRAGLHSALGRPGKCVQSRFQSRDEESKTNEMGPRS